MSENARSAREAWDERYSDSTRMWSGNPNPTLVREVSDAAPGDALDLGCGEGADALWLAARGWRVTAVDVSQVALDRGAHEAEAAELGGRIDWQCHDLAESFPEGAFDLISAQFLQSFEEFPREDILRRAVESVRPGGVLLVVTHGEFPSWSEHAHDVKFPTAQEVLDELRLPEGEWETLVCEPRPVHVHDAEGEQKYSHSDTVVKVRRLVA